MKSDLIWRKNTVKFKNPIPQNLKNTGQNAIFANLSNFLKIDTTPRQIF